MRVRYMDMVMVKVMVTCSCERPRAMARAPRLHAINATARHITHQRRSSHTVSVGRENLLGLLLAKPGLSAVCTLLLRKGQLNYRHTISRLLLSVSYRRSQFLYRTFRNALGKGCIW